MVRLEPPGPGDLLTLRKFARAFHAEDGHPLTRSGSRALRQLVEGTPHALAFLVYGGSAAPIGYVVVALGFSVQHGGVDSFLDDLYIRPADRGRGLGSQVLAQLRAALRPRGVKAMHLGVMPANHGARRFYRRHGFKRSVLTLMTRDRL